MILHCPQCDKRLTYFCTPGGVEQAPTDSTFVVCSGCGYASRYVPTGGLSLLTDADEAALPRPVQINLAASRLLISTGNRLRRAMNN